MSIKTIQPMEFQLHVLNPYIIAFHHRDIYPEGDNQLGPKSIPRGKNNGQDFDPNSDWRMYHGKTIPGFPVHPHRGFETITIMLDGYADHFDSKGSKGRYGKGDVQWMTAGKGIQHSEMFPLLNKEKENPMELFQIWLNLPKKDKLVEPAYKMLWAENIPVITEKDKEGRITTIRLIAGQYKETKSIDPLPASWAYNRENNVGIWLIQLEPNAEFTIPAVSSTISRVLYNFRGAEINITEKVINEKFYAELYGDKDIVIGNGNKTTNLLLLEGEPINEPIAAQGPFVMNTQGELRQAFIDYQQTEFGGWPWDRYDPVNDPHAGRFSAYEDEKRTEYPNQ